MKFDPESRLILKHVAGSQAYGTAVEDSDTDYRGIVIPTKSYFLGLDRFEQHETKNPDLVYYDIRKFVHLAISGNPNILESLFVEDYLLITKEGTKLRDIRQEFLSKACAKAYIGYAQQQLYRLRIKVAPASRTERRMALVEQFGYDTKYALHVIRLLRTAVGVLRDGVLLVKRPDADMLLDIRNGKYTIEQIEKMAEDLLNQVRELETTSSLPARPDYNKVNRVVVEMVSSFLREKDGI